VEGTVSLSFLFWFYNFHKEDLKYWTWWGKVLKKLKAVIVELTQKG